MSFDRPISFQKRAKWGPSALAYIFETELDAYLHSGGPINGARLDL